VSKWDVADLEDMEDMDLMSMTLKYANVQNVENKHLCSNQKQDLVDTTNVNATAAVIGKLSEEQILSRLWSTATK
jgi:hypothetical protein